MPHLTDWRIIGAVMIVLAGIVGGILFVLNQERSYDRSFDGRVSDPAYRANGPIVLFDEHHLNTHTTTGGYKPLADLLRSDGYTLRVSREPLTAAALEGVSVLVLALARGANDANDDAAYSDSEAAVIEEWVRGGGSLLLITDHWPYGSAVRSLAGRFDITMGTGLVEDSLYSDPDRGDSHLVFSLENGLLRDHPIVRGRSSAEQVRRVLTFTGQSLQGPAAAMPFLALSDAATELPPGAPKVERDGGDIRVSMEYGAPVAVAGRAQGLALDVDAGRMVVLGEAGMCERNASAMGLGSG